MNFLKIVITTPIAILLSIFMFSFVYSKTEIDNYSIYDSIDFYQVGASNVYKMQAVTQQDVQEVETSVVGVSGSTVDALNCPYGDLIVKWAKNYNEDPLFIASIVAQESDFGKDAGMSSGGALGIIQIKIQGGPIQELKQRGLWESSMSEDMTDPDSNLHVACCYLKYGMDRFVQPAGYADDYGAWAAGYNGWWPTSLKGNPPYIHGSKENRNYYYQVKQRYEAYKSGALEVGKKGDFKAPATD